MSYLKGDMTSTMAFNITFRTIALITSVKTFADFFLQATHSQNTLHTLSHLILKANLLAICYF